jgi:hypothetical protein
VGLTELRADTEHPVQLPACIHITGISCTFVSCIGPPSYILKGIK